MKDNDNDIWISKLGSFTLKIFKMTDNYNPVELYKRKIKKIQDRLWSSVFLHWHFNKGKILTLCSSSYGIKDSRPDLEKFSGSDTCTKISKNL